MKKNQPSDTARRSAALFFAAALPPQDLPLPERFSTFSGFVSIPFCHVRYGNGEDPQKPFRGKFLQFFRHFIEVSLKNYLHFFIFPLEKVLCSSRLKSVMYTDVTSRLHVRGLALVCIILFLTAFFTIMCLFPVDILTASGFTPCDFPLALTVGRSGPMPADQSEFFILVVI